MIREYAGRRVVLGASLAEAFRDLMALDPATAPTPGELSDRFLGWVRDDQ